MTPADIEAIRNDPELVAPVERIKATPPNPAAIHHATPSLAEALENAPKDPDFDLETWTRQWTAIEAEMKAIDRADAEQAADLQLQLRCQGWQLATVDALIAVVALRSLLTADKDFVANPALKQENWLQWGRLRYPLA